MHQLSPYLDETVLDKPLDEVLGWKMDYPSKSRHFWEGALDNNLSKGTHTISIRTTDMFGNTYTDHRIFRVN
jgi:hypothetical protein